MRAAKRRPGFSLVELIVVVVIIGILAAIAIPRFSRGATGAGGSGVRGNLQVLRNAIELYYYEHGEYPGKNAAGGGAAAGSEAAFIEQLTKYSDADGTTADTPSGNIKFGPYLRKGVPPCPVAPRAGMTGVKLISSGAPAFDSAAAAAGWIFNYESGDLCVNSNDTDADSVAYDTY